MVTIPPIIIIIIITGRRILCGRRGRRGRLVSLAQMLLPVFLPVFRGDLPLHALAGLVRAAGNLLKRLIQRQIMSDRVLYICQRPVAEKLNWKIAKETHLPPTLRMAVERVLLHDPLVDAVQRKLLLLAREDRLRDHGRIAVRRLQVLGRVLAVVDLLRALHHHTAVVQRRLLRRRRARSVRRPRRRCNLALEELRSGRQRRLAGRRGGGGSRGRVGMHVVGDRRHAVRGLLRRMRML